MVPLSLHTKSRKIDFRSVQACNNRGKSETISGLKQVKTKYKNRSFTMTDYHGGNAFEHLCDFLAPTHLHTCAANEHIGTWRDPFGQSRSEYDVDVTP